MTEASSVRRMPNRLMIAAELESSNHTSGAAARDRNAIGRAMISASGTALRSASCLGTSSPTTTLR